MLLRALATALTSLPAACALSRRQVRLPSRVHADYGQIKRATAAMAAAGATSPSDDEVSAELLASGVRLSPQRVRKVVGAMRTRPASLDAKLGSSSSKGDERATKLLDLIPDETTHLEADVVQSMLRADLAELMRKHLKPFEMEVGSRSALARPRALMPSPDPRQRRSRSRGPECRVESSHD